MRRERLLDREPDLSFANFGDSKRLYPAPTPEREISEMGNYAKSMARREGFAGELRSPAQRSEASSRTPLVAALPLVTRSPLATPPSGSKKNPNPRKINDLRSDDRHIAA